MPESKSQSDKSADQILDELFTTLGTASTDVEPLPPGAEEQACHTVTTPLNPGAEESSSKVKKKKKEKKSKKKKRKKSHDEEEKAEKRKKKKKKDRKDENKEEKKEEGKELKRRGDADEAETVPEKKAKKDGEVAEPKKVAKPDKGSERDQEAKKETKSRTSPLRSRPEGQSKSNDRDRKKEPGDESKKSREKETSRSSRRSSSPSRRRSRSRSRSPAHSRRFRAAIKRRSSRSRSRSPPYRRGHHPLLRRSRSPPYRGRRRSSKSPIVLKRPNTMPSPPRSPRIDKAQLLEVARQNLKRMQELGTLPANLTLPASLAESTSSTAPAGSKPTGKTVAELTDYCKNLAAQPDEPAGGKTGGGSTDGKESDGTDAAAPSSFTRHPFQVKPRPDVAIVLNIRNAVPLPVRKPEERASLKQQFPISSGQQHQELEWVPVPVPPPEKDSTGKKKANKPNATVAPTPRVSLPPAEPPSVDIGTIVAKRISSIRKLQENDQDIEAQLELQEAEFMTQSWANYHHTNPLTGEPIPELINWSGAPQAWVRKDQFSSAAPVAGGVGMRLLQKMGWQPGEGLGRNKEGTLEPLSLDIKMDKKGLVSKEELAPSKTTHTTKLIQEFQGKHPVSILHELCVKRRWEPPDFEQVADMGPDHLKHFLFKVRVNGIDYQPSVAGTTKKDAKAQAAAVCLMSLGIHTSQH